MTDTPRPPTPLDIAIAACDAARKRLEAAEKAVILAALEETHGNRTRAAELLGMPVRTLHRHIAAHPEIPPAPPNVPPQLRA